ncbi:MAG: VCBS repeat-containing protein, partial [Planctomycetota bacterium]
AVAVLAHGLFSQTDPVREVLQIDKPMRFLRVHFVRVDGDDRDDLVAVCATAGRRELRTWRRRTGAVEFGGVPSIVVLEKDVVAFAFVTAAVGAERALVLFTPERAVLASVGSDATITYTALFSHRLVWPAADPDDCLLLADCVLDLDGDGRSDLVVPEPDSARVLLQQASESTIAFAAPSSWSLPPRIDRIAGKGKKQLRAPSRLEFRLGGDDDDLAREGGPLVSVRGRTPPIQFADLDGDKRADGFAVRNETIWWWAQTSKGAFQSEPSSWPLPLPEDRLAVFDPAFDVQMHAIDGDARADLVVTTSAQRDGAIEVRVDLYRQREGGEPFAKTADSRLRMQSLAGAPQVLDVDGDGDQDLVTVTLRTDLLTALDGPAAELDVQCNVFQNVDGRFVLPAMLTQKLALHPRKARRGGGTFVRAIGSPDGRGSAILVQDGESLQLRPLVPQGRKLALADPSWRVPTGEQDVPAETVRAGECVIVGEREATVVRWR